MVISYWQGSSVSKRVYTDRTEANIPKGERALEDLIKEGGKE